MPVKRVSPEEAEGHLGKFAIDLASSRLNSKILAVSDEFFASASNLLTPGPAIRKANHFVATGAWYDGWETRRHNRAEADWVIVKLGVNAGYIHGIEVDTAHFNGNHAPEVSLEGAVSLDESKPEEADWESVLEKSECGPNKRHCWLVSGFEDKPYSYVRLRMYPDGGIARLRVWGVAKPIFGQDVNEVLDLASALAGGVVVKASDSHFGAKENLILPGRGENMGDGWETKRSRGEHVDWAIVKLAAPGYVEKIIIDTLHFRGNFPREAYVHAIHHPDADTIPPHDSSDWIPVSTQNLVCAKDTEHEISEAAGNFNVEIKSKPVTHVKMTIVPDGGVKRLRVFGRRAV